MGLQQPVWTLLITSTCLGMRGGTSYLGALQGSSPSAVQASPASVVQVSSLSAPQAAAVTGQTGAEEQNVVITANRHKTYSDTDLAEMETGVPMRLCALFSDLSHDFCDVPAFTQLVTSGCTMSTGTLQS